MKIDSGLFLTETEINKNNQWPVIDACVLPKICQLVVLDK